MGWVDPERQGLKEVLRAARAYRDACKVPSAVGVRSSEQPWTIAKEALIAAVDEFDRRFGGRRV